MTLEEAEHQIATRLYQNTAKVHFNQHEQAQGQFKRRLVYGGVVISLARALSFNGLANAFHIAAINGGRHVAPCFAGDTVYAWSEVLEKAEIARPHATSARCGCGWSPSRTARAPTSPCATPRASTPTASSSTSTCGWCCRAEVAPSCSPSEALERDPLTISTPQSVGFQLARSRLRE